MSFLQQFQSLVSEPPPDMLFELTESSLAAVTPRDPSKQMQELLPERGALASPAAPNLVKPALYHEALDRIQSGDRMKRPASAAIVIPDYAVRMAIIDLEEFPASAAEQLALLRFRLRKTVPFPIDEAQLSYSVQRNAAKQVEVLALTVARPILQEYEGLLTAAGYRVGVVLPSSLAALRLCTDGDRSLSILVKIAGSTLSVVLMEGGHVRLIRCLDLEGEAGTSAEHDRKTVMPVLQQTLAYAEDNLHQPVKRLLLCGFGPDTETLGEQAQREFGIAFSPLRSKFGATSQANAGLLGLLEQYAA